MIIKELQINMLHDSYNYDVKFNKRLTFLFGENGCGKTTILNILFCLVTGRFYSLIKYKFKVINLVCEDDDGNEKSIKINRDNQNIYILIDLKLIETISLEFENYISVDRDNVDLDAMFYDKYRSPSMVNSFFNYIYVPVTRNLMFFDWPERKFYRRNSPMGRSIYANNRSYLDESLHYVENLIKSKYMIISSNINRVNDEFKSRIFTSSLNMSTQYNIVNSVDEINYDLILSQIDNNQEDYINTLKSISEWNDESGKKVKEFFKRYKEIIEKMKKEKSLDLLTRYNLMNSEFRRIQTIAEQAGDMEERKQFLNEPIKKFVDTVNIFLSIGKDRKVLSIQDGRILIRTTYTKRDIGLENLSSGEKQIIILFAYLIFNLPKGKKSIYIVDEPEVSLHISWQQDLIKSIYELNLPLQLIFATHSPEIIGEYDECSVELKKEIDSQVIDKVKGIELDGREF